MHQLCIVSHLLVTFLNARVLCHVCNIGKLYYDVTGLHRQDVFLMIMHDCKERTTLNLTVHFILDKQKNVLSSNKKCLCNAQHSHFNTKSIYGLLPLLICTGLNNLKWIQLLLLWHKPLIINK